MHISTLESTAYICAGPCFACFQVYMFVNSQTHVCVCVYTCRGWYSLKNTSPQQSEGRPNERAQSRRDAPCLQERSLNNGAAAVGGCNSSRLCVWMHTECCAALCNAGGLQALLSRGDTAYFDQQSNKLCLGFLGGF